MARILVVDDRPDNLLVVDRFLSQAGHEVDAVKDAEAALERIAAGRGYALFVLDVVLPGLSGYELCQRIRSREDTRDTPVLFLTGERAQLPDKLLGFESGANDYLQKPIAEAELIARVNVMLQLQDALRDIRQVNERLESVVEERTVQLREALQSLERQRNLWQSVVHGLPAAVLLHDDEFRLVQANDVALECFGALSAGSRLCEGRLAPFFGAELRAQLESGGRRATRRVEVPSGESRIFEAELTRLESEDSHWLLHLVDVTERQAAIAESEKREVSELQGRIQALEKQLEGSTRGYRMANVLGNSAAMAKVHQTVGQLRNSRVSVLICGESGTGKELVARAIHFDGQLRDRPFVPVHCGAIPESLAESELFGYVKGAFTGAASDSAGLFQQAHGGTIFLDEIGECSPDVQSKLLRVLQSGEIRPVGSATTKTVQVRLIAATHRPLAELVREGRFREDLYYRLNVVQVDLPPLRSRPEDVPILAKCLLEKHAQTSREGDCVLEGISREAMQVLEAHRWEGNVRELENVLVRAATLSRGPLVQVEDLSPRLQALAEGLDGRSGKMLSAHGARAVPVHVEDLGGISAAGHARDVRPLDALPSGAKGLSGFSIAASTMGAESDVNAPLGSVAASEGEPVCPQEAGDRFHLPKVMQQAERQAIQLALRRSGGNKLLAAKLLGIGKSSLYRKLKELGIGL